MKKLSTMLLAGALAVSVMGFAARADEIKVWVADNVTDFTNEQIEAFKEANPDFAGYDYVVEPVGEGDAAGNMITDVEAGADIFGFAQDQISRLVSAGALIDVEPENAEAVIAENDPGAVAAATVGDVLYAYPLTSDNGYFLYYDKSVVSDPSTLEGILADCEAAGKNFYMEINSGWYQTAFFFATGAQLTYETDDDGNFTACNAGYATDAGLVALKKMVELKASPAFQNGSAVGEATNVAAIVDGTWDASAAQDLFGENYACAKLPTFEGADGKTYQMSGFGKTKTNWQPVTRWQHGCPVKKHRSPALKRLNGVPPTWLHRPAMRYRRTKHWQPLPSSCSTPFLRASTPAITGAWQHPWAIPLSARSFPLTVPTRI